MQKRCVNVLKNSADPPRYYTGIASDVARRTAKHNAGNCVHTAKYRPWCVDLVIAFTDERRAVAFERYLKSGSGVAFAQRHLRYEASLERNKDLRVLPDDQAERDDDLRVVDESGEGYLSPPIALSRSRCR